MATWTAIGYGGVLMVLAAIYQFYVSICVVRASYYSPRQKAIQIAAIWIIPLLAAITCHAVLVSTRRPVRGGDPNFVRDDSVNPPGIG